MIKPSITPQEVITAIKHAVKLRGAQIRMAQNMASGMPALAAVLEAARNEK
jgi:hypothetical protein